MRNVDVAIVGGSLAGATCVRELTRLGIDAVAFERDAFPREKVCGGFLSPGAVSLVESLGMLQAVRSAGATEVLSTRVRTPGVERTVHFAMPGLGISRRALDALFAGHAGVEQECVRSIERSAGGFNVRLDGSETRARVVIDAAGKLSLFSERESAAEFGVQFYDSRMETQTQQGTLDFWFFKDGYGGSVAVEGNRANCCFLIRKNVLRHYMNRSECLVTGPIGYEARPSPWLAIGDAAGMVDPFCGEGIRHALDTGRMAAAVVARGLRDGWMYDDMRRRYRMERDRRWAAKRAWARWFRRFVRRPEIVGRALGYNPEWFLKRMWA